MNELVKFTKVKTLKPLHIGNIPALTPKKTSFSASIHHIAGLVIQTVRRGSSGLKFNSLSWPLLSRSIKKSL